MKYLLEFEREVTTRDGYSIEVEVADGAEAAALAERMTGEMDRCCPDEAQDVGPVDCGDWEVVSIKPVSEVRTKIAPANIIPVPANDTIESDRRETLLLPSDIWEGLLRAAEAGCKTLGTDDRAAIAGLAALKLHVATKGEKAV